VHRSDPFGVGPRTFKRRGGTFSRASIVPESGQLSGYPVWGVWRWHGEVAPGEYLDVDDWARWDFWEGTYEIRADAINAALRVSSR
jgi:hypothetical protein